MSNQEVSLTYEYRVPFSPVLLGQERRIMVQDGVEWDETGVVRVTVYLPDPPDEKAQAIMKRVAEAGANAALHELFKAVAEG